MWKISLPPEVVVSMLSVRLRNPTLRSASSFTVSRARETSVVITDSDSLGTPPGDVPAATQALAARWAEAHPAVAASTLFEQAAQAAIAAAKPEADEPEPAPEPPAPP
jgi:hypothetical protein